MREFWHGTGRPGVFRLQLTQVRLVMKNGINITDGS